MSAPMPPSIRKRTVGLVLAAVLVLWAIVSFSIYRDVRLETDKLLDAQLVQTARLLLSEAPQRVREQHDDHDLEEGDEEDHVEALHDYEQRIHYQFRSAGGDLLYRSSAEVPLEPLANQQSGFGECVIHGSSWRSYVLWNSARTLQVQIGMPRESRESLTEEIAEHILLPALLALPLLGLAAWLAVAHGLRPLGIVAREVAARSPQYLAHIETAAPEELTGVLNAINGLMAGLDDALLRERRFSADAAHELRTPLAALKTQAQVALASSEAAARDHALQGVVQGVDRMTRLMEQLLTLARVEAQPHSVAGTSADLAALARTVAAEAAPAALARGIELSISGDPCQVRGNADLLRILIRNLLDNAVRHSPAGATVRLEVLRGERSPMLRIADEGPGIPPEERGRVFDRFYRMPGTLSEGSGLGLSIVARIAALHAASIELNSGEFGRGLVVTVAFTNT